MFFFLIFTVFTFLVLFSIVENIIILIFVLIIYFLVTAFSIKSLFVHYIDPIKNAIDALQEMNDGNYQARFSHPNQNVIGELSNEINALARNMREYAIHEKMQREQLSTIIENTENGIMLIDEKGYIHLVNRKFLSLYGRSQNYYKGHLYYEVLEEEVFHQTVQKAFLYEKNIKNEFSYQVGLDWVYYEILGVPIFNEKNRLRGAVIVLHDITELKMIENMRRDFVANVSHELRTPITSIRGFAETLLDEDFDDEEARREFLHIIYNESDRMQLLIEDLLTLSRLEQDNFQLVLNDVNIQELLKDMIFSYEHKAKEKNLSIDFLLEPECTFKADRGKVKQIIINLLDNAIHYTPEGGKVSLQVRVIDEHVLIQVSDTGIGIDQASLPRIFERFYRIDKARSRNTGGTGLGLAIVKHIVDVHEGKIEIDSELNKGTTVNIYLPKR